MGLGTGLTIAATGLRATQTWADTIARNIANATTEGYTRKDVELSTLSGGVTVSAFNRDVSSSLDRMTRASTAKIATQDTIASTLEGYTSLLGQPDDETSPVAYLTAFQTGLETLAADPSSAVAQRSAIETAGQLVSAINAASSALSSVSTDTEKQIQSQVTEVNDLLTKIGEMNTKLTHTTEGSLDNGDLQDEMGKLLDKLSGYVDFSVSQTTAGLTTVYAPNGLVLVDSQTTLQLGYDGSRLTAGGTDITPADSTVRGFNEGSLSGLFELKREILPEFAAQLNSLAAGLITGFSSADASLTSGQAGLFTDNGAAWDGVSLDGLAARLTLNPDASSNVTLIRDGFGATVEGEASDTTQINAFLAVFDSDLSFDASAGLGTSMTLSEFTAQMVATQQSTRSDAESSSATLAVTAETISASRENLRGVNIDDEMQKLLMVQQGYAANSKVLTSLIEMMDTLLEAV